MEGIVLNSLYLCFKVQKKEKGLSKFICFLMGQYGISPNTFQENQNLSSFFKVLTTSTDEDNKVLNGTVLFYVILIHKVTLNI